MARTKLNVLVYTGTGATSESVRHCMYSLRRLLSPNYAVIPITESVILKEPWQPSCALLVFPGGADLGYCRVLNGTGNSLISSYVRQGGSYLGFCAGGYYGARKCEFEVGNKPLEVIGTRELAFYPGTCRGGAFKGFQYHSEGGARAVKIQIAKGALGSDVAEETMSYFNGGGVYVDAAKFKDEKVEVLATFGEETDVDGGDGGAAVVLCRVGQGKAILTGPHPEFSALNLNPQPAIPNYADLINSLTEHEQSRRKFLAACLEKLGLEVPEDNGGLPPLSELHLTSINNNEVSELLCAWGEISEKTDGKELIRGGTDTFQIVDEELGSFDQMKESLIEKGEGSSPIEGDYSMITKRIVAHEGALPSTQRTPRFDHHVFYSSLSRYRLTEENAEDWGNTLLYGDVVTSTNSLLEKNPQLMAKLPTGFTCTASTQIAGRGRGTNVWIAPPGQLIFSTIINHPAYLAASRPVVFVQYIAAIAIVEAIQSYGPGYENLPVKLKWPNDIYALDPTQPPGTRSYVKIGGILSQCGYSDGAYQMVLGIGINTTNPKPTTSISDLLSPRSSSPNTNISNIPPLRLETLLARILTRLESIYTQFRREGFSADLESRYYKHWLHTGQAVRLEEQAGAKARVLGITTDWGMLKVEETDREGRGTGKIWALQSDENSFDYWKGLVKRKV